MRPYTDHVKVATAAKAQPGEWTLVNEYRSTATAVYTVHAIRTGMRNAAYLPASSFEVKSSLTDDGTAVYVRFVGDAEGGTR
jgi:hypothetical protein